jgi:hypothetical protein
MVKKYKMERKMTLAKSEPLVFENIHPHPSIRRVSVIKKRLKS